MIVFVSILTAVALVTSVQAAPQAGDSRWAFTQEGASEATLPAMAVSTFPEAPSRLATLNESASMWVRASRTSVSNVLVLDPSMFGSGQSWNLGEDLFHSLAETTNFTPPDDPDFPAIASLLTDGINEWVELDTWLPGGGGTSTGAQETYWLNRNPDLVGTDIDFIRLTIHDLSITPANDGTQVFENYTWEIWGHPIFVAFYPPTDPNGSYLIDRDYTNVNVSLAEPGAAVLEWNGANRSMEGSGMNWRLNVSGLANGVYSYRVWATNSTGAAFVSHVRILTVGVGVWSLRHATIGFYPSIAFDANGTFHMCFYGASIGPLTGLVYGTFNTNGWQFTQVDGGGGDTGQSCAIALDHSGHPHISYIGGPDYYGNFYVRYGAFDGTSWNLETVDEGYYTYTSIALDPANDLPRIAYAPYAGGLRLATYNGSVWNIEVVDPSADGATLSLALDSNGRPGIAYANWSGDGLKYARWTGSAWNFSVIADAGFAPSLRLDANGGPHVAYITRTGVSYASRNGTDWSNETVDIKSFSSVSLALDSQGVPHVACASAGWGGDVRYASKNGTWTIQVVSHNFGGSGLSMALGPSGSPGIAFVTNLSLGDLAFATTAADTLPPSTTIQMTGTPGAARWFRSTVQVTLVATDDVAVRNTTYRVDGDSWQTYSGPFALDGDGDHVVDYYSTDVAGNAETVKTASLRIDSSAPFVRMEMEGILGRSGWYRSSVNVALAANDNTSGVGSIRYRLDNGPWITYSGPFPISGDGAHYVQYTAFDVAGNSANSATALVKIDSTPPSSSISVSGAVGASGWYTAPPTVSLSAADTVIGILSISYSLDGREWRNYTGPVVIDEGRHVIAYRAEDEAGNIEAPHTKQINVDATPPLATITSPSAQTFVASNSVEVTWTATDDLSGIDHFELALDGGLTRDVDRTARNYTFFGLSDGSHTVELRAVDSAGLTITRASVFMVDATEPTVLVTSPGSGAVITSSSTTVKWIASDKTSGLDSFSISVDGGSPTILTSPMTSVTLTNLADGTHTVTIQAVDRAGNVATSMTTFRVDTGVFSPSGPYGLAVLAAALASAAAVAAGVVFMVRRRGARPPDEGA